MKFRRNLAQIVLLALCFSLLMVTSCKKENSQSAANNQQESIASKTSSESDGQAEIVFNGVFDDAMGVNNEVGMAGTGIFGRIASCPVVTVTHLIQGSVFPIRVVLDFGTAGCTGNDGHLRKGKVTTEYTNRLIIPGAIATTTFDGFYYDSIKVEGTHKITNTSGPVTPPVSRQFTADVISARLSLSNGNYTEWNSHKVITQIEGLSTPDYPHDDAFQIEGNAHGRVLRGSLLVAWESNIIDPLIKRFICHWIVKGKVKTVRINSSPTGPWVAVLDFGNGNCDNQALITINGVPYQITLP